jgi:hypothetical protein
MESKTRQPINTQSVEKQRFPGKLTSWLRPAFLRWATGIATAILCVAIFNLSGVLGRAEAKVIGGRTEAVRYYENLRIVLKLARQLKLQEQADKQHPSRVANRT